MSSGPAAGTYHRQSALYNDQLMVVPYRPGLRAWLVGLTLSGYFLFALLGYLGAYWFSGVRADVNLNELLQTRQRSQGLQAETGRLRDVVATAQQHLEIERQAIEFVRQENQLLQAQVSSLEEQVAYYKRVMKPNQVDNGLVIGKLNLKATSEPHRFRYHFNLMQVSGNRRVAGRVFVNVLGILNGQKQILALQDLSTDVDKKGLKVGFKNFQSVEGELSLVPGFKPEQVEIIAQFDQGKSLRLQKKYDWTLARDV